MLKRLMSAVRAFRFEWRHYSDNTDWSQRFDLWKKDDNAFKITHEVFTRHPDDTVVQAPVNLKRRCVDANGNVRFFDDIPNGCTLADYGENIFSTSSGQP